MLLSTGPGGNKETRNINDKITFKLTEEGKKILEEYKKNVQNLLPDSLKDSVDILKVNPDDTIVLELHKFANIFGKHLIVGNTGPMENNSFKFID